ncbi:MAG: hypothetical protein M1837_002284 [Sclerophora amabilis]|nr:MAG: hypothetical protein M1837_002284 [Sclerophora amabilis]
MAERAEKSFRPVQRYITTHDPQSYKTTFKTPIPETVDWDRSNSGADLALCYTTEFPPQMSGDADLKQYAEHLAAEKPPFLIPGGLVVRYVDFHPDCPDLWHRTVTTDLGVVVEGEIELALDSGEKRVLKRGDVAVQRGTNHSWRNPSKTEFARALFVGLDAKPITLGNGEVLGESFGEKGEIFGNSEGAS